MNKRFQKNEIKTLSFSSYFIFIKDKYLCWLATGWLLIQSIIFARSQVKHFTVLKNWII